MKLKSIFSLLIISLTLWSCAEKEEPKTETQTGTDVHKVKVEEALAASNYTYLLVSENNTKYWIAVPSMQVEIGEELYFSKSMEMKNFRSEILDRTFESVLFVEGISRDPHGMTAQMQHPDIHKSAKEDAKVETLKDGYTIEQIYAAKETLAGKVVKLRGKVTKFNSGIMDRNWIHIQDGTGSKDDYDLLATSNDMVDVGQTVVIEGTIAVNRDFGAGYIYPVLIENAKVVIEKRL
jgi:hypothetical protein